MRPPRAFVGRDRELALLRAAVDAALEGTGHIVLLAGEPGIGKTTTAEELARYAEPAGVRVLWGRCFEGDGAPAFWPWLQVIRAYVQDRDAAALEAELGPGAAAVAQLVPEAGERLGALPPLPALPPDQARFRLFESIARFLQRAAAARPLLVVLDDLHWADVPSLLLLEFLVHALPAARILVVGTFREDEVGPEHPLTRTLAELSRSPAAERLYLQGLSAGEVARCIEHTAGVAPPEPLVGAVCRETDGNPFFVMEVVRLLLAEGGLQLAAATGWQVTVPPTVREVITRRVRRLSPVCTRVLTTAAMIGRGFEVATLARAAELAPTEALEALDEAVAARLVTAVAGEAGRYRFMHALIRETLYQELGAAQRVRLHRRAGEALEEVHRGALEPYLAELAHHFHAAALDDVAATAVRYAVRAAEQANRLLAYEEAVRLYAQALGAAVTYGVLNEEQRCDLLLDLGDAQLRTGDTPAARATFDRAAGSARGLADGRRLSRAAVGYGGVVPTPGRVDERLVAMIEDALPLLGEDDGGLRARLLGRLAMDLQWTEQWERRDALSREAVAIARRSGDPLALGAALNTRRYAIWSPDTLPDRLEATRELVELGRRTGNRELCLQGLRWRIPDLLDQGDVAAADADIAELARLAEEVRQPLYHWYVAVYRALRALQTGAFAGAEHLIQEAFALGQRAQSDTATIYLAAQMFVLRREQGRIAEVEAAVRENAERYPRMPFLRAQLAHILLETGRPRQAGAVMSELASEGVAGLRKDALWLGAIAELAHAAALLDDRNSAAAIYDALLPYAERNAMGGVPICYGAEAEYLGMLAATMECWAAAEQHFVQALALNRQRGFHPFVARTQYGLGRMLLQRGRAADRERALSLLREAEETASVLGMSHLQARIEATSPRAPERRSGPAVQDALSEREREVLRLIAAGKSNREIAAELVISLNTVFHHVSNILAKTGAANRTEAAAYAHRHGLIA